MLSVALKHFGAEFFDDDERDLFSSFATIEDGKLKVFFFCAAFVSPSSAAPDAFYS